VTQIVSKLCRQPNWKFPKKLGTHCKKRATQHQKHDDVKVSHNLEKALELYSHYSEAFAVRGVWETEIPQARR